LSGVLIVGVGMTAFGKTVGRGIRALATAATDEALADAGMRPEDVQKIFFGNAVAGIVSHQEMIRGQVAFRHHALARVPLINVENACASGGSALSLAFDAVAGGQTEVAMAVAAEQLNHADKRRSFDALRGSTDIEEIGEADSEGIAENSILMDFYAGVAREYLEKYGADAADFARVAVKNRRHAAENPLAHLRKPQTIEEVLNSRMIAPPLTLPMCSPMTDGAAAVVVCSPSYARKLNANAVELLTSQLSSSAARGQSPVCAAAARAYAATGVGPSDFDVIELHDAAAPAELLQYAEIGLCREGEAHHLVRRGVTDIGGDCPVNTSGGLLSRGHPLGATGLAQVVELCTQLRGRAGRRQVEGARLGLAINGGGWLDGTYAVALATIVRAVRG
jgi:acetyl-CoA acyltransferase